MSQPETPHATLDANLAGLAAHRTRYGTMIVPPKDAYVGRSLERYGEYSRAEVDGLVGLLKPGMWVVEVGAHVGALSVPLARACAPGPFYVFEPQQRLFQMLCANLVLNGVRNAIVSPDLLGAEEGAASLPIQDYASARDFGRVTLQKAAVQEGPFSARVRTLDSFRLNACHLLKVDAPGWETEVLKGAQETIARCRPFLYVDARRERGREVLMRLIDSLGYDQFWHAPMLFHPQNFNGARDDVFPGMASLNLLCTPKERNANIPTLAKADPDNIRPPLTVPVQLR